MKTSIVLLFLILTTLVGITQSVRIELNNELSTKSITTIKLYRFNSKNTCNQSKAVSIIFDNKISTCFDLVKTIKKENVKKIINCLRTKKTYGNGDVACFDTDYGLIMYNVKRIIVGYVNISLFCNKINAAPLIQEREYFVSNTLRKVGLSIVGRKKIMKLLGLSAVSPYPSQPPTGADMQR